ncbi:hypothetical protein PFFVO_00742, partial [Plasmodium falciparum Vietnam Oak-Knoll (FVO)]
MARGDPQGGGSGGAHGSGDAEKYKNAPDAKHLLDIIGKDVHDKVKEEAKQYKEALTGQLSFASIFVEEMGHTNDPCIFDYDKLIGRNSERNPCKKDGTGKEEVKRFSKESGGECANSKIKDNYKGSNDKDVGACAPYRRLSLCNKNFQNMNSKDSSKAKHNLLLDVCLAAKYEGESLNTYSAQYDEQYPGSGFTLCTMLARSFADIGDIVRGRDLYLGKKKKKQNGKETETERDQLEEKLQSFFKNIHDKLDDSIKSNYNDAPYYYKLREDWWTANRETVWEAMTCSKELDNSSYFRATCNDTGQGPSQTHNKCRCDKDKGANAGKPKAGDGDVTIVPTYFDYVPQYLRWFEEWAEDFCRKKKKKLENLEKQCRGKDKSDEYRYCSRNGYDCEQTISRIGKVRMGKGCTDCFFACHSYENWIDNQRKQFDKQKKKYTKEISDGGGRKKRAVGGTTKYEGYEKSFYEKLKNDGYGTVDAFLGLLNNEKACKDITDGGKINFKEVNSGGGVVGGGSGGTSGASGTNDENKGTFYRSEYCQPCPDCGVQHKGGNQWEEKDKSKEKCDGQKLYKPINGKNGTPIKILKSGEGHDDIEKKLKEFCLTQNSSDGSVGSVVTTGVSGGNSEKKELYDEWKCYKHNEVQKVNVQGEVEEDDDELKGAGGLCILPNPKKNKEVSEAKSQNNHADIQKTFHDFFYYWVAHMLKDSIHWRTKRLKSCISDGKTMKCRNGCNKKCDCFEKWVKQKETEWKPIKDHFKTQEGIPEGYYFTTLELILKLQFLKEDTEENTENSLDAEEAEELKHLQKILKLENENNLAVVNAGTEQKTLMDKLLNHELNDATKCKDCPLPEEDKSRGRSADPSPDIFIPRPEEKEDDENEDDDEDEVEDDEETAKETTEGSATDTTTSLDVCAIVGKVLTKDNESLQDACSLKYGGNNSRLGWRCVTPSGEPTTSSDKNGAICVPPRRRRLYIKKIVDWATKTESPQASGSEASSTSGSTTPPDSKEALLKAFVESAAIETFFLWHRYKEEKKAVAQEGAGHGLPRVEEGSPEVDPEDKLKEGKIPDGFLRQMFYTLGDYRDILFSGSNDTTSVSKDTPSSSSNDNLKNIVLLASGSTEQEKEKMNKIQKKIKETLESGSTEGSGPKPSVTTPQTWWENNGKYIWHGMVCALTYKDNDAKGVEKKPQKIENPENLWDEANKKPKPPQYQYTNVKLDENSGTSPRTTQTQASSDNTPTTLTHFVKRPTYFRWFEEWGESFCRERKKRLKQIKVDCKVENGDVGRCSGDGEACDSISTHDYSTVPSFNCPGCGKHCSSYRKWIERKKIEFHKQSNAYGQQKTDATRNNGNTFDKEFCKTLETWPDAAKFLERLKNGPCKTNKENGEDDIDFEKDSKTFQHTEYCGPCPKFKTNCQNGNCGVSGLNGKCDGKDSIDAKEIAKMRSSTTDVVMRVSDNDTNTFEGDDLKDACQHANIFKGIRKDVWKCGYVCGVDICEQTNINERTDGKEYIQIRALFKRWVENFLEDYNKINDKISHCIKKGEGSKCINGCEKNCKCLEKWIEKKIAEWENIKKRFNDQYENKDQPDYNVKSILEELIPKIAVVNDQDNVIKLCVFENSKGCTLISNTQNNKENDAIDCMLKKLGEKAKNCPGKPSGEKQSDCKEPPPLPDEEDQNPEENTLEPPKFCPPTTQPPEEKGGETCGNKEEKKDEKKEESEEPAKEESGPAAEEPAPTAE